MKRNKAVLLVLLFVVGVITSCNWKAKEEQMRTTSEAIRKYDLVNEIQALPFDTFHYGTNILFQSDGLVVNPENSEEVFTERDATKYQQRLWQRSIQIYHTERIPWEHMRLEN